MPLEEFQFYDGEVLVQYVSFQNDVSNEKEINIKRRKRALDSISQNEIDDSIEEEVEIKPTYSGKKSPSKKPQASITKQQKDSKNDPNRHKKA